MRHELDRLRHGTPARTDAGGIADAEVRKRWVQQRLDPCCRSPVLRSLWTAAGRDAGNSEDIKNFPGGMLVIGGANSPASLSSMPIRFVLCDEVDRFPWEVGQGPAWSDR